MLVPSASEPDMVQEIWLNISDLPEEAQVRMDIDLPDPLPDRLKLRHTRDGIGFILAYGRCDNSRHGHETEYCICWIWAGSRWERYASRL